MPKTMNERWKAVAKWYDKRGINQVYSFFVGCDPELRGHEQRIRFFLRNQGYTKLVESDEPWLSSMERTIEALNQRKAA